MKLKTSSEKTVSGKSLMMPGSLGEDNLINSVCYQALREKERLIKEYKFKYETTKALYEELLNVLIAQNDKPCIEQINKQNFIKDRKSVV